MEVVGEAKKRVLAPQFWSEMRPCIFATLLFSMAPASAQILAVSREANRALVGGKTPEIWSLQPWKRRLKIGIAFQNSYIQNYALSRDGKLAAFGRDDSTIEIFEAESGRLWKRLGKAQAWRMSGRNHYENFKVSALAFSPNRRYLASGNSKGVFVWRVRDGKLLFSRPLRFLPSNEPHRLETLAYPRQFRFSSNGQMLAIGGEQSEQMNSKWTADRPLFLLQMAGKRLRHLANVVCEDGDFEAIAFGPTGKQVFVASFWRVSGSAYNQYHLFDTRSGRVVWKRNNMELEDGGFIVDTHDQTNAAVFASNGRFIAVGGPKFLEMRRARDGKRLKRQVVNYPQDEAPDPNFARELRFCAELAVR